MMRSVKSMVVATSLALLLGACGSSSSKSNGSNNNGNGNGNKNSSGSGNSDFNALLDKANKATYKMTYTGSGDTSFTVINKPPRAALVSKDSSQYQTADGKLVTCTGSGSSADCTAMPAGSGGNLGSLLTAGFGSYGTLFKTYGSLLGGIKTSSETIAGRDAECVNVDISKFTPTEKGSVVYCADKELGLTLRIRSTDDKGKTENIFEATDVSTDVSDSDVTPPAEPKALPTIPTTP
jgi:hypothetical protein